MKLSRRWGTRLFVAAFYGTAEEGAEKIDFGPERFFRRLKSQYGVSSYGATEVAPLQNSDLFRSL
jgi:hypothetical protein